jgi:hypothetical protein
MSGEPPETAVAVAAGRDRRARLSAELRRNLARRKERARTQVAVSTDENTAGDTKDTVAEMKTDRF